MTPVEAAIKRMTNHGLSAVTDRPRWFSGKCQLISGEEPYFVAIFSDHLQRELVSAGHVIPYHQLFYTPSRRTEWKMGFDLSIGRVGTNHRLRTMHKIHYKKWCDGDWEWNSDLGDDLHMAVLLSSYSQHSELHPYLVVNICYCIHDYRRMGTPSDQGWSFPDFPSRLRTVIIDLPKLAQESESLKKVDWLTLGDLFSECMTKKGKKKKDAKKIMADHCPSMTLRLSKSVDSVDASLSPDEYLKQVEDKSLFTLQCGKSQKAITGAIIDFKEFSRTAIGWYENHWNTNQPAQPSDT